jgi:hypothetical protein
LAGQEPSSAKSVSHAQRWINVPAPDAGLRSVHDLEDDLEDQHILDRKRIKLRESAWYPHYVGGTIVSKIKHLKTSFNI